MQPTDRTTSPAPPREAQGAAGTHPRRRLIGDAEVIRRRAEGQALQEIADAAGVTVPTISAWLKRNADALEQARRALEADAEIADREAAAAETKQRREQSAARSHEREATKRAEPQARGRVIRTSSVAEHAALHSGRVALRKGRNRVILVPPEDEAEWRSYGWE